MVIDVANVGKLRLEVAKQAADSPPCLTAVDGMPGGAQLLHAGQPDV